MTNKNSTYKRLGDYIREINVRNKDLSVTKLMGINIDKYFMPSVANVIGTDMSNYKVVANGQFACNLMHVGRDEKIPIALNTEDPIIVSPAYFVFEVCDNTLLPEYLELSLRNPEFDRNAWFHTDGDVRGGMDKEGMKDLLIPVPPLEEQRSIVSRYKTIETRIANNKQTIAKLEEAAQALYRKMFVDDVDVENLPDGWRMGCLGEVCYSFSKSHSFKKEKLIFLNTSDVYDGKILISNYSDVTSLPGQAKKSIQKNDILFSEIRPANKRYAFVRVDAEDYVVSTKLMVLRCQQNTWTPYRLYNYLISNKFLNKLQEEAEGASGTFPQITFDENLSPKTIIIADAKTEKWFSDYLRKHYEYVWDLEDENKILIKMLSLMA